VTAPEISIDELAAALEEGLVPLVDVRQPEEYEAVHVPGAKLIPLADVVARIGEIPRDQPVYVICATGNRSLSAASYLARAGIDAWSVAGGTAAWARAGRPVVRGG